jgi:hypothetical protein
VKRANTREALLWLISRSERIALTELGLIATVVGYWHLADILFAKLDVRY